MRGVKQLTQLRISTDLLEDSIRILKSSHDKERVILWLGQKVDGVYVVQEVFTPIQLTEADYFRIPVEGMDQLMSKLKSSRRMLVAQVHTHPFEAFHSRADDEWAIVRHVGAYSLVLPFFCSTTNMDTFISNVASFTLTEDNNWVSVDNKNIRIQ